MSTLCFWRCATFNKSIFLHNTPSARSITDQRFKTLINKTKLKASIKENAKTVKPTDKNPTEKNEKVLYDGNVAQGEKKDVNISSPKPYSSGFVEPHWYSWWEKQGYFSPKPTKLESQTSFAMVMPPPNVTGHLHLGHALTVTIQDVLVRRQKMLGNDVMWLPGTDHASISTQMVVERHLAHTTGETKFDLGREKFLDVVWEWKESKGNQIFKQLKRLGVMLDWSRETFTMDPAYTRAVNEAFIRLHEEGLIYRDERLVSWSCAMQSTLSDLEVEKKTFAEPAVLKMPGYDLPVQIGMMCKFAYELTEPVDDVEEIVVATTRLETILGDTAVAVHPNDARYSKLIGRRVKHPFIPDFTLPVIADKAVDPELGTGALKVTPAHDYVDFEIGKRHSLPSNTIFTEDGCIPWDLVCDTVLPRFMRKFEREKPLPRFEARFLSQKALLELDLFRGSNPHPVVLDICSRSGDIVEPMLKQQWFVRTSELAGDALNAVETGKIKFVQSSYHKLWKSWLTNPQDWCISRQLWWGQQIPVYFCEDLDTGKSLWVSAHSESEAAEKASFKLQTASPSSLKLRRDPDVLDTWFSSSLYPFAALGWPNMTDDMQRYYPLTLMETGQDLIFFWVARMVMMGIKLTGQIPFKNVLFHAMIRDGAGRKMSKTLGNVIDPLQVINGSSYEERLKDLESLELEPQANREALKQIQGQDIAKCGADALRMSLCAHSLEGDSIRYSILDTIRHYSVCNKVWSVARAVAFLTEDMSYLENRMSEPDFHLDAAQTVIDPSSHWINGRLLHAANVCNTNLSQFNLSKALRAVIEFWNNDLSSVYLECVKSRLRVPGQEGQPPAHPFEVANDAQLATLLNLVRVVETALRLLTPFAPYLSEELWQRIPKHLLDRDFPESVTVASFPTEGNLNLNINTNEQKEFQYVLDVTQRIRSAAVSYRLTKASLLRIFCRKDDDLASMKKLAELIPTLTYLKDFEIMPQSEADQFLAKCIGHYDADSDVNYLFEVQQPDKYFTNSQLLSEVSGRLKNLKIDAYRTADQPSADDDETQGDDSAIRRLNDSNNMIESWRRVGREFVEPPCDVKEKKRRRRRET